MKYYNKFLAKIKKAKEAGLSEVVLGKAKSTSAHYEDFSEAANQLREEGYTITTRVRCGTVKIKTWKAIL